MGRRAQPDSGAYLLLALNFTILAITIAWIVHRYDSGLLAGGGDSAAGGDPGGATRSAAEPPPPLPPQDRAFAPRGKPGDRETGDASTRPVPPRIQRPRPRLDASTAAQSVALDAAIRALGPPLEVIRAVRGSYPGSRGAKDDANRGIEAVVVALRERGILDRAGLALGDTDRDGRDELLDPWGHALVYFSADDYESPQDVTGVGALLARERWVRGTRRWCAEARFQLFSVGPDGADDYGGNDDVTSWVLR